MSGFSSGLVSGFSSGLVSGFSSGLVSGISSGLVSGISSGLVSGFFFAGRGASKLKMSSIRKVSITSAEKL